MQHQPLCSVLLHTSLRALVAAACYETCPHMGAKHLATAEYGGSLKLENSNEDLCCLELELPVSRALSFPPVLLQALLSHEDVAIAQEVLAIRVNYSP